MSDQHNNETAPGRTMNDIAPDAGTRLWTSQGFRNDVWRHAEIADAVSGHSNVILPLPAFLELHADQRQDRDNSGLNRSELVNAMDCHDMRQDAGVLLQPSDPIEAIAEFVQTIPLVALSFPAFSDGRSFSKAALLRSRYGFAGRLRATGQILIDQLPHMLRLGFDEFEITHPVLIKRLERGETGGIPLYYQPSATHSAKPAKGVGYSWRRMLEA